MGILDSGNWVLCKRDPEAPKLPKRGDIHLTISNRLITLSPEARKTMENPKFMEVWVGKDDGRVLFICKRKVTVGSFKVGKSKNGTIRLKDKHLLKILMETLILYGSMEKHIGNDDKPLPGAYFCVQGSKFRERDPKDKRCWLVGVEFDLAKAYYCQMSVAAIAKAQEALQKKRNEAS